MTNTLTPAMAQYYEIKKQYSDAILFFRMWDFYEMFEEDAQIAHDILWISLTSRNKNAENPVMLAGIPYHAKEKYLPKLIEAGYKVAIAEQVSSPKAKGIVEREVQRVITPATLWLEMDSESSGESAKIMVWLVKNWDSYAISIINFSTFSWSCSEFSSFSECASKLYTLSPSEVILEKSLFDDSELHSLLTKKYALNIYYYEFSKSSYDLLCSYFWTKNLESFWIEKKKLAQEASWMLINYLKENQKTDFPFLKSLYYDNNSGFMQLDESTIKSLDLVFNVSTGSSRVWTLFWTLDYTKTPMGKRNLRHKILHPLQNISEIKKRQSYIKCLKNNTVLLDKIWSELQYIGDVDNFLSKLSLGRVWPKDILNFKKSLISIKNIQNLIYESWDSKLISLIS